MPPTHGMKQNKVYYGISDTISDRKSTVNHSTLHNKIVTQNCLYNFED